MLSACEAGLFRACSFGPEQGKWGRPPGLRSWRLPGWFPHLGPLGSFRLHSRHRLLVASGSCELVPTLLGQVWPATPRGWTCPRTSGRPRAWHTL